MRRILISFVATFAVALAVFVLAARGGSAARPRSAGRAALPPAPPPNASTDQRIARPAGHRPRRAQARRRLDAAGRRLPAEGARDRRRRLLRRAPQGAVDRALALRPGDPGALTERGALELSRHDFRGRPARRAARPPRWRPTVDQPVRRRSSTRSSSSAATAQAGARAAGDGRPQARPRRLRARLLLPRAARRPRAARWPRMRAGGVGRRRGARERRLRAARCSATSSSQRGRIGAAVRAVPRGAAGRFPGYAAAEAGLARVDVARGRLAAAIARAAARRRRGCRCPSYVIALGEARAGRRAGARRAAQTSRSCASSSDCSSSAPASTPTSSWRSSRPTTAARAGPWRSAAAPGRRRRACARPTPWAGRCTRAGHPRAGARGGRGARWRLGSRDPAFLTHAGLIARSAGEPRLAARLAARRARGPRSRRARARALREALR